MKKMATSAVIVAACLLITGCGGKTSAKKPATTGDPLAKVQSHTLGTPRSFTPGSGAMAMCDDNKTTVKYTGRAGTSSRSAVAFKGSKASGEDCTIRLTVRDRKTKNDHVISVAMLVTPSSAYTSELVAGGVDSVNIAVPDDSTLFVFTDIPGQPNGLSVVHQEGEEPLGKVGEIMRTDQYVSLTR